MFALFAQAILAQAPPMDPVYGVLLNSGVLGSFALWMMWTAGEERKRQEAERIRQETRQAARDAAADRMADAINNLAKVTTDSHNHLVRSILIEATSRPIAQRARDEAESILESIGRTPRG